jgi:hypothetical protein
VEWWTSRAYLELYLYPRPIALFEQFQRMLKYGKTPPAL